MRFFLNRWVASCRPIIAALGLMALTASESRAAEPSPRQAPRIRHVLLIGVDGARPEHLRDHGGPTLRHLIARGTVCWQAQAMRPSVTQVNWPSMLTGSRPETHGVTRHPIARDELAEITLQVPTAFEVVGRHGGTAAGFLGHWKLHSLQRAAPGTFFQHSPYNARDVAPPVADYLEREKPTFCFVWMGDLDGLGHRYGWLAPEQLAAMPAIDAAIARLLEALQRADMLEHTLILIGSDHGGHGKGHGQSTPADMTIPWIAVGPGIRAGHMIDRPLSIADIAPTLLYALGLPIPEAWDGKPVLEAFEASEPPVLPSCPAMRP